MSATHPSPQMTAAAPIVESPQMTATTPIVESPRMTATTPIVESQMTATQHLIDTTQVVATQDLVDTPKVVDTKQKTAKQLFVFATLGTDHHPFDRFIEWMDAWQSQHGDYEIFVQRGTTTKVPTANSAQWLEPAAVDAMMRRADVIVCHGGPSTIMEARAAGVVPVVLPRDPSLGEHVDGHQMRFCEFMSAKGAIRAAHTESEFFEQLSAAMSGSNERVVAGTPQATLDRISSIVGDVMERPTRSLLRPWKRST